MERLICIVIGYIFGLIQSGYLYGKANHMISASTAAEMPVLRTSCV